MEIVKNPKINWLGMKWIFIGVSSALVGLGSLSIFIAGLNLGVDFTGGTLVYIKFREEPQLDRIRQTLNTEDLKAEEVIRFDDLSLNEIQIRMARTASPEE